MPRQSWTRRAVTGRLGSALAGGWVGLVGAAIANSIVIADVAEAGYYNNLGMIILRMR